MSKNHDITIIAGLSGVGKTYVINVLLHESGSYTHFSAGSLITKRLASLDRDQLRELDRNNILANQYLMTAQFQEELLKSDVGLSILFDAHMIIDNDSGIVEIPYEIFEQLSPTRLVFLFDEAEKIIVRRGSDKTRKRPVRTSSEIEEQQRRSIELAQQYCARLGIPFIQVHVGDMVELSNAMR